MKKITITILLSLVLFALAACSSNPTAQPATQVPQAASGYPAATELAQNQPGYPPQAANANPNATAYPAQNSGGLFQITRPDGTTISISLDEFNALTKVTVENQTGIKVSDAVALLGEVLSYQKVTIVSPDSQKALTKDQVTDDVILAISSSNSIMLVTKGVPQEQWLKNVTLIKIE